MNAVDSRAAVLLALLLATILSCATTPAPQAESTTTRTVPPQSDSARGLIVIVHGANHTVDTWPVHFVSRIEANWDTELWDIFPVNWSEQSDRYLTAAGAGLRLGEQLGRQLAGPDFKYEAIHLIASSMGAYVIHGLAAAYRASFAGEREPALVHMTFIEPFLLRGLLRPHYGAREFGANADFAENYFTPDDPVLFSNTPLRHAVNFDLTAIIPPRADPYFTYYHDHPIYYYRDSVGRIGPGFALSPLALGLFSEPGLYRAELLREVLPEGEVVGVD